MGFLPELGDIQVKKEMLRKFAGLNHNLYLRDEEFYEMRNMTSDFYPVLSPRKKRHRVRRIEKPNGLYMHNKLAWVDGTQFYYDGKAIAELEDGEKKIVGMGAYIVIFPDKVIYNTHTDEFEKLGNIVTTEAEVKWTLTNASGTAYTYTSSATEPENPKNKQYWLDTSDEPHVLKQYSKAQAMWVSVPTTYVKIAATGIGKGFSELDTVTISGMTIEELNGDFSLQKAEDNYVIVTAIIDKTGTQTEAVTLERKVPDLDFITECDNRIWGCSNEKHEIYACKQGDAKNWYAYNGISSDSYTMTVGTRGDFTGAVTHLGYITFFKEDVIQKIYGTKPANYQLTDTQARGVEKGSEKSVVLLNETVFYLSKNDICSYATSLPQGISKNLGTGDFKNGVGGTLGRKYYISMQDEQEAWGLYVYDTDFGTWHKEDGTHAVMFASGGNELYYVDSEGWLWNINGSTAYDTEDCGEEKLVTWFAETGPLGMESPDAKYISKLQFRVEVGPESILRIEIAYDGGNFVPAFRYQARKRKSFTVPIVPKRCDTMRVRISGEGECRIFSMAKTTEQGSEI